MYLRLPLTIQGQFFRSLARTERKNTFFERLIPKRAKNEQAVLKIVYRLELIFSYENATVPFCADPGKTKTFFIFYSEQIFRNVLIIEL